MHPHNSCLATECKLIQPINQLFHKIKNILINEYYLTLLTAVQGTDVGSPANRAACLSGACPILAYIGNKTNQLKKPEEKNYYKFFCV